MKTAYSIECYDGRLVHLYYKEFTISNDTYDSDPIAHGGIKILHGGKVVSTSSKLLEGSMVLVIWDQTVPIAITLSLAEALSHIDRIKETRG